MIPRIRGKVGQGQSDDPKLDKKWFFSIWVTTIGGGEGDKLGDYGPFDTEEIAQKELEGACQMACDAVAKNIKGGIPGQYIDMKDNKLKKWGKK